MHGSVRPLAQTIPFLGAGLGSLWGRSLYSVANAYDCLKLRRECPFIHRKGNTLCSVCFACTQRTLFAADDTSFFHLFPLCLSSEESPLSQVTLLASCSCVQSTSVEACASTCGLLLLHSQTATRLGMRTDLALFRTRRETVGKQEL